MRIDREVIVRGEPMLLVVREYEAGRGLRLDLLTDAEPYATVTVNLPERHCSGDEVLVRLGGAYEGLLEELVGLGVLEDIGPTIAYGWNSKARLCRYRREA